MPSCKDKYKWCKDEFENGKKAVYIDEAGMEYCVFHAPKEKKGMTLEGFNNRVFKRIDDVINVELLLKSQQVAAIKQRAIEHRTFCDLSDTVFEGDISFSRYNKNNPIPDISFVRATFNGEADFYLAKFRGEADFYLAKFSGEADFWRATFSGEANFFDATFSRKTNFIDVTFSEKADFGCAKFSEFDKEANFDGATFNREADFSFATFSRKACFNGTKLSGGASFRSDRSEGGTFKKGADFRNFYAKEKVRLEGVNLKEVSFLDSDLRNIDFINCEWQKQGGRDILYDEVLLFGEKGRGISQKLKLWRSSFKQRDIGEIKKVEILYRRLKQKYVDEHNWPEVSNWHYGEKEMLRKQTSWFELFFIEKKIFTLDFLNKIPKKLTYDLYWLSSGYGEMPVRAGITLGCLIFGISFFMYLSGFEPSPNAPAWVKDLKDYHKLFVHILNTLQYITFLKEPIFKPASLFGEYLVLFSRILIPIQTALFVLAIRNRFRR